MPDIREPRDRLPRTACTQGVPDNVFAEGRTFKFVQDVLSEVIALFPGPYVHIGGDEVQKDGWRQSAEDKPHEA